MRILILNGSPRARGNTKAMTAAFAQGAREAGHDVAELDVCRLEVAGCLGCEACHRGDGACVQADDMVQVEDALSSADMLVIASSVYYFGFTAQLQAVIHRMYAKGQFPNIRKCALIMSSGSDDVYEAAVYEYQRAFVRWMHMEDMGMVFSHGAENGSPEKLAELRAFGAGIE